MFELMVDNEIKIRTLHPDDAAELFALLEKNRQRLRPWIHPSALPETPQATRIFTIECYFNSIDDPMDVFDSPYFEEIGHYFRGLADPPMEMGIWLAGRLVGAVSVSFLEDDPTTAELGYWITEEHEGKGIITRCVLALMNYALAHLRIEQFIIGCADNNRRSRAIPERLGYQLKEIKPNGEIVGEYVYDRRVYEIQSSEWWDRIRSNAQDITTNRLVPDRKNWSL